jgi:hypothetical protein
MAKVMKSLCVLALIAGAVLMTSDAQAGFFSDAATRFMNTFKSVRTMVLIFGGFGLIVLAVAAILGKIKWAALGALAAGLAIVAVAGKVVDYATGTDQNGDINYTSFTGTGDSGLDLN